MHRPKRPRRRSGAAGLSGPAPEHEDARLPPGDSSGAGRGMGATTPRHPRSAPVLPCAFGAASRLPLTSVSTPPPVTV